MTGGHARSALLIWFLSWSAGAADRPCPQSYEISIDLSGETDHFAGELLIRLEATEPLHLVRLDANAIQVATIAIDRAADDVFVKRWSADDEDRSLLIEFSRPLMPKENVSIAIRYRGRYEASGGDGLVRNAIKNDVVWSTQLQPAAARKIFPAVDDPSCRSRFQLTIVTRPEHVAFSNTAADVRPRAGGRHYHHFAATPPMPPHLVAFVAGDLKSYGAPEWPRLRIIAPRSTEAHYGRLLSITGEALERLETWLDRRLAPEKLDVALVPEFRYFGMENPGLLVLRAGLVEWAAAGNHWNDIRELVAHELAHQWFGNEISPARWRDVWISESFATWAAYRVTGRPPLARSLIETIEAVRGLHPPIVSSHPIVDSHPEGVFTSSRYGRGAHLLESTLGGDPDATTVVRRLLDSHDGEPLTTEAVLKRLGAAGVGGEQIGALRESLVSSAPPEVVIAAQCDPDGVALTIKPVNPIPASHLCLRMYEGPASDEVCVPTAQNGSIARRVSCPEIVVPVPHHAGPIAWTYADRDHYSSVFKRLARLDRDERFSVLASLVYATWAGRISASDALRFAAMELASSTGGEGDGLRRAVLGALLSLNDQHAGRRAFHEALVEITGATSAADRLLESHGPVRELVHPPAESFALGPAELERLAQRRAAMPAEEWTNVQSNLFNATANDLHWLIRNPELWEWRGREAYDFLKGVAAAGHDLVWARLDPADLDHFIGTVVPRRYWDNIAGAFAHACSESALRVLLGSDHLREPETIEQRDTAVIAIARCVQLRKRQRTVAASSR